MRWLMILGASACVMVACERQEPLAEPSDAVPEAPAKAAPAPADPPAPAPAPAPEPGPSPQEQAAMSLVRTVEALGALHQGQANDCAGLATALEGFHREHGEALTSASPEALAWIDAHDETRARMSVAMGSVMTVSMQCRDDAAFQAVQETLFGDRTPQPTKPE